MWPKVIAQLFELLPHISRMVPLADRYLNQKSSSDQALTTLSEGVRSDLGKVARAHIDLAARLDDFAAHVAETSADTRNNRLILDRLELRLTRIEHSAKTLRLILLAVGLLLAAILVVLVLLLVHAH